MISEKVYLQNELWSGRIRDIAEWEFSNGYWIAVLECDEVQRLERILCKQFGTISIRYIERKGRCICLI